MPPYINLSRISCNDEYWHNDTYLKRLKKKKSYVTQHPLSSAGISIFHRNSAFSVIFFVILHFNIFFSSFNCLLVFKGCFDKHGSNFGDVSKIRYSGPS